MKCNCPDRALFEPGTHYVHPHGYIAHSVEFQQRTDVYENSVNETLDMLLHRRSEIKAQISDLLIELEHNAKQIAKVEIEHGT